MRPPKRCLPIYTALPGSSYAHVYLVLPRTSSGKHRAGELWEVVSGQTAACGVGMTSASEGRIKSGRKGAGRVIIPTMGDTQILSKYTEGRGKSCLDIE